MRLLNSLVLAFIIVFISACNPALQGTELVDGEYAPGDHWSGQWRVVNIWAQWCKPCWQEIPELNRFHALQGAEDVKLLGYNFDQLERNELLQLKQEMSIQFPVLTAWPENWHKPEVKGLPATIIMAPDDSISRVLLGPQSLSSLHKAIKDAVVDFEMIDNKARQ